MFESIIRAISRSRCLNAFQREFVIAVVCSRGVYYDDDYDAPDYHAAERQPEYFSPRPNQTQGSDPVQASVKWFNADKGFGFVIVAGGSE